jgi:hypothetical protein
MIQTVGNTTSAGNAFHFLLQTSRGTHSPDLRERWMRRKLSLIRQLVDLNRKHDDALVGANLCARLVVVVVVVEVPGAGGAGWAAWGGVCECVIAMAG